MNQQEKVDVLIEHHLKEEHDISPFSSYLKEIVYGGSDGIVTTFAVVAGFSGAQSGNAATYSVVTVLLFGLANLFADASSMALGNFLSSRSEKDFYRKQKDRERYEVRYETAAEKNETFQILRLKGFNEEHAKQLTEIYATNKEYWVEFMMNHELKLPNPEGDNPFYTSLATFVSFITFGAIPLLPFMMMQGSGFSFHYSIFFSLCAMLLLGTLRWRVTKQHPIRSIAETVLLGSLSASIAYVVGICFRT